VIYPCYTVGQVKKNLNIKKYIQILLMFFFITEKIKSCEGLLDVTWLTLLVQKEFIQPVKKNFN